MCLKACGCNGMEKLVQNSAEENGVWQMMVAASSLHERQEHDLDKLRLENNELKHRIDGQYATSDARTRPDVLGKINDCFVSLFRNYECI